MGSKLSFTLEGVVCSVLANFVTCLMEVFHQEVVKLYRLYLQLAKGLYHSASQTISRHNSFLIAMHSACIYALHLH